MNNEKVQKAIDRLKAFEPADEPYYFCYSGEKDSECTVFNCMFNVFGVCTKPGSKFKENKADDSD